MSEINMDPCKHGLIPASSCLDCRAQSMPTVYVSGGGMKYHATRNCPALVKGQKNVDNPTEIVPTSLGSEIAQGRKPCRTCSPPEI